MTIEETLLEIVREKSENQSVTSIAKKAGVHQPTLSRWLLGQRGISLDAAQRLIDTFPKDLKKRGRTWFH